MASTIITGGSRGLGLELAKRLANQQKQVVILSRTITPELHELLRLEGQIVRHFPLDLEKHDDIKPVMKEVRMLGPIEALVNNAAIGIDGMLTNLRQREIEATLAINLTAPILLARAAAKSMLAQGRGKIVNVSSVNAFTGYKGLSVYAAAKAGLIGFTRSLARELGPAGIQVNAIAPGLFETDLVAGIDLNRLEKIRRRSPLNRFATTAEVANTVMFLLNDQSSGMTGSVITVDAGNSA